jgi:Kef-type K+ transport system membrane component KefB
MLIYLAIYLEAVTLLLFMPLFFALTGIRTNLLFANGSGPWLDLLLSSWRGFIGK